MEIIDEWTLTGMRRQATKSIFAIIEHRFGPIVPKLRQSIEQMPIDLLDQLTIAVLDFNSMDEAQNWVRQHAPKS